METISVRNDSRKLFRIRGIDQVYLRELAKRREELQEVLVLECLDVREIEVHVTKTESMLTT